MKNSKTKTCLYCEKPLDQGDAHKLCLNCDFPVNGTRKTINVFIQSKIKGISRLWIFDGAFFAVILIFLILNPPTSPKPLVWLIMPIVFAIYRYYKRDKLYKRLDEINRKEGGFLYCSECGEEIEIKAGDVDPKEYMSLHCTECDKVK